MIISNEVIHPYGIQPKLTCRKYTGNSPNNKKHQFYSDVLCLAAREGFEPSISSSRVRRLTTWPPGIANIWRIILPAHTSLNLSIFQSCWNFSEDSYSSPSVAKNCRSKSLFTNWWERMPSLAAAAQLLGRSSMKMVASAATLATDKACSYAWAEGFS